MAKNSGRGAYGLLERAVEWRAPESDARDSTAHYAISVLS